MNHRVEELKRERARVHEGGNAISKSINCNFVFAFEYQTWGLGNFGSIQKTTFLFVKHERMNFELLVVGASTIDDEMIVIHSLEPTIISHL